MRLILIRHGESLADILNVIEGRADFDLTEKGVKQALAMSKYIASEYTINKIYSSSLKRAKHTAEILSNTLNIDIQLEDDLMEFNNGKLAGLSREVANILYPKDKNLPFDMSMYDMESLLEFRERSENILNKIISQTSETDTIVIVSHGGMINRLYRSFMELEYNVDLSYPSGDTGIHIWEINDGVRTIRLSNYTEHLESI